MTQPIDIITQVIKNIAASIHTAEVIAAYKVTISKQGV